MTIIINAAVVNFIAMVCATCRKLNESPIIEHCTEAPKKSPKEKMQKPTFE